MARLYADENFPFPVVEELRRLGHDVLTIPEAGQGGQAIPDEAVLAFACANHRAVLTLNRKHFIRLYVATAVSALKAKATDQLDFLRLGLIQCRIVHQG